MAAGLLTAGAGHAWETDVVALLDHPGAPLSVVRRCADVADLLATASTGQAAACLLAADLRRLDSDSVQQLEALGVTVVAVHAASDPWASVRLQRIGVTVTVPDDADATAIVDAVRQSLPADGTAPPRYAPPRSTADPLWALTRPPDSHDPGAAGTGGAGPSAGVDAGGPGEQAGATGAAGSSASHGGNGGVPAAGVPVAGASTVGAPSPDLSAGGACDSAGIDAGPIPDSEPDRRGTVVAVWGPGGAPGRSTVAMGLADRASAAGRSVLLVDADVYGGILASAFGLLDESPGLAGACRLAANGRLDTAELATQCWTLGERLALLTGIARADRWPEVRPSAIPSVLQVARRLADLVIVDCSAVLETDEELSFDTMAPRRNGATLAVLDDADAVIAVGSADPPGMERLVRGLSELAAAVEGPAPRVVLNRVRRTAASAGELSAAVRRFAGMEPVAMLPEDRAACDRAWTRGVTLTAAAAKSPLVAEFDGLVRAFVPAGVGAGHRAARGIRLDTAAP